MEFGVFHPRISCFLQLLYLLSNLHNSFLKCDRDLTSLPQLSIDTTHVLTTTPYFNGTVDGWYYNLTCTMSGCLSAPICTGATGAYCDEVGYTSGASDGFNYCSPGYVVTANNTCQAGCGSDYYCNSGSSCYNNQCDSCQSCYVLGNDGLCHAECGNSGNYCTGSSSGYNGECLSCPSGYYLATNGDCYQDSGYTSDPTTTIQSSGAGSCGSFELTESSPDSTTSGSCTWSGGYLNVAYSTGQLVAITFNVTNNDGFSYNKNANNSNSNPIYCLSNSQSEYLPSGTYHITMSTGNSGATCSNSEAYVSLSG